MTHEFEPVDAEGAGLSARQKLTLAAGAVLVAALVIFVVQNLESTRIEFLGWDGEMPRWLLIVVSAAMGSVLTMIAMFFRRRRA